MDQTILDNIISRIVDIADPERIILFGSAARGDMNRHSDVDLLIVKEGVDTLDLMRQIRRNLYGVGGWPLMPSSSRLRPSSATRPATR